jgi:CHAD domain-containing protein
MRAYAIGQISALLSRLEYEIDHTRQVHDADAVHDLRVTIRRFGQSLRVFSKYIPRSAVKRVRKQLRHIMDLAGEVRNLDITLDLLDEASITAPVKALKKERKVAARELITELERWKEDHEAVFWRAALELPLE